MQCPAFLVPPLVRQPFTQQPMFHRLREVAPTDLQHSRTDSANRIVLRFAQMALLNDGKGVQAHSDLIEEVEEDAGPNHGLGLGRFVDQGGKRGAPG